MHQSLKNDFDWAHAHGGHPEINFILLFAMLSRFCCSGLTNRAVACGFQLQGRHNSFRFSNGDECPSSNPGNDAPGIRPLPQNSCLSRPFKEDSAVNRSLSECFSQVLRCGHLDAIRHLAMMFPTVTDMLACVDHKTLVFVVVQADDVHQLCVALGISLRDIQDREEKMVSCALRQGKLQTFDYLCQTRYSNSWHEKNVPAALEAAIDSRDVNVVQHLCEQWQLRRYAAGDRHVTQGLMGQDLVKKILKQVIRMSNLDMLNYIIKTFDVSPLDIDSNIINIAFRLKGYKSNAIWSVLIDMCTESWLCAQMCHRYGLVPQGCSEGAFKNRDKWIWQVKQYHFIESCEFQECESDLGSEDDSD